MNPPNFSKCTEEELWKFVGYHLSKAGIESVLVGGAVVAVYSKGAYRSGDLDLVAGAGTRPKIQAVLEALGSNPSGAATSNTPIAPISLSNFRQARFRSARITKSSQPKSKSRGAC